MDLLKLNQVSFTMDSGKMDFGMEEANRIGLTVQFMKAIGLMIWRAGQGDWFIPMEMSMKGFGLMIKHMEKEFICIGTELATLENGLKISSMVTE